MTDVGLTPMVIDQMDRTDVSIPDDWRERAAAVVRARCPDADLILDMLGLAP